MRLERPHALKWCLLVLVLLAGEPRSVQADGPVEWQFTIQADQKLPLPARDTYVQSYVALREGQEPQVLFLRRDDEAQELRLDIGGDMVALPHQQGMVISRDGRTVVQRGVQPGVEQVAPVHFHWIWSGGAQLAPAVGPFTRETLTTMSEDGHLGIADLGGPGGARLRVYGPKGVAKLTATLPPAGRVIGIDVLPGGAGVLILVSAPEDRLADHQLYVLKSDADAPTQLPLALGDMRIRVVQQRVVFGNRPEVFVQGLDHVGVVNYETGKVKWIQRRRMRLVSRFAARSGPLGTSALLVVHGVRDRKSGKSTWFLEALDNDIGSKGVMLGSGEAGSGRIRLPHLYRGAGEHVFERVDAGLIRLIAGMRRIAVAYSRKETPR